MEFEEAFIGRLSEYYEKYKNEYLLAKAKYEIIQEMIDTERSKLEKEEQQNLQEEESSPITEGSAPVQDY